MKRIIPTKVPLLGAALWGAMLLAGVSTQAADIYQTANQTLGINWNTGVSWGTPAAVAAAGNNYISGGTGTFVVRTLDASTNSPTLSTFVGNKLTLTNNGAGGAIGSLVLKNGGGFAGLATANIEMAGGTISYNTANQSTTDWRAALGGTISVTRDSTFNAISSIQFNRDILLLANLSGTGNLTVAMVTNSLVLLGTNTAFSGNWTNTTGSIEIGSNAQDPLGTGVVTLVNSTNALRFNATNNLVLNNVIQGLGGVAKLNSGTLTLGGNNTYTGSTSITNGVLKLVTPISSSTNIILAGGTLDATSLSGGGLTLNAANFQSLKCNGSVTGNLTVNAANPLNFTVTSTTNDILNVSGSLTLSGTPVTLNVKVPTFKAAGTYRLINYTGAAIPTSSFNLVLDGVTSQTYVLSTTANQVNLVVVGVPKSLTWLGVSGDWDTTSLNWTNSGGLTATNFSDGDSVTFDDSAASFLVYVNNSSFNVIPNSMVVSNVSNAYTIYGDGISTAGKLTKQGAADLIFTSPSNNFTGPIDIQAGVLSIGSGGGFGALGAPTAITNNGTFRLNLSSGGIAVNAPISGSGAVEVLGASTLTLNGTNSYTGFTTINDGCQLFVSKPNGLGTTDSGTRVLANGKFGVNIAGTLEVAEPLFVNGTGIATSPGALYAINGNTRVNFTGPIVLESSSRFRMVSTPVFMTFSNTVTGSDVELWCTTGNTAAEAADTITFASSLTLGSGGSFFKDGSGVVNLDSAVNTWGSTLITNGTLAANNVLNGGTVTVTGGALGGSGTVNGAVDVQAGGSIAPGKNGIGTLTLNGVLTLAAGATNIMQVNSTNAQTADKLVAASIPLNGTVLNVVNTGPALQLGDSFDLFDGAISGPVPTVVLTGNGFAAINYVWDTSQLLSSGVLTVTTNVLPYLPLDVTKIDRQPNTVGLTWNSYPSLTYTLEYSYDLFTWAVAQANIPAAAGTNVTSMLLDTSMPVSSSDYTLVQYQMGTTNAQIQDAAKTMAAGPLTQGSGLILFNANATVTAAYDSAPELQVTPNGFTDEASAYANSAYFTFALTVGTNVTDLDLTSLSFNGAKGGASAPRGYAAYVILPDGTTEVPIKSATDFTTTRPNWGAQLIDLTSVAGLQNLTAGQVITFKITVYTPATTSSVEFDDIVVKGNVSPGVPAPYAGADKLFLRIKQQ